MTGRFERSRYHGEDVAPAFSERPAPDDERCNDHLMALVICHRSLRPEVVHGPAGGFFVRSVRSYAHSPRTFNRQSLECAIN